MADNSLQNLMNTFILPMALPVLREACMMPALVSRNFDSAAHEKNAVIRVPLPQDLGPADDFDTHVGSGSTALSDPKVDIVLDRWKYKQFEMNDKEMRESVTSAVLPSAVDAAIKSVANAIDLDLLALGSDIPYRAGTPGTAATKDTLIDARMVMNDNLVPAGPRAVLWNSISEADLLKSITVWDQTGVISTDALREANMGKLLGFDNFVDQLVPVHTSGTATADVLTVAVNTPKGSSSIPVGGSTGAKTLKKGDLFTIAGVNDGRGRSIAFAVAADQSAVNGSFGSVPIYPKLPSDVAANAALTFVKGANGYNYESLAFHRDAFMLAMRTLTDEANDVCLIGKHHN